MIISSQTSGEQSTLDYCATMREKYSLGDSAWCDPTDELLVYGKNALVLLLDSGGTIVYKKVVASHGGLVKAIEEHLPL